MQLSIGNPQAILDVINPKYEILMKLLKNITTITLSSDDGGKPIASGTFAYKRLDKILSMILSA